MSICPAAALLALHAPKPGAHHCIVEARAELANLDVLARGMNAIREQHRAQRARGVAPDGSARKAEVTKRARREKCTGAGALSIARIPADHVTSAGPRRERPREERAIDEA